MEAIDIVLEGAIKLGVNKKGQSELIKFILDNPSYHYSIVTNQKNLTHVMHDISGLMRDDEFFLPRVLFKNDEYKEVKEKLTRYYELDLDNCKMTNKMWIEELAKCMIDSDDYVKDFNLNLKKYDDERNV
tara:strand:- start:841 stop:1230 length:390 start_codon:yes stop_codon:yes gene_type:complete